MIQKGWGGEGRWGLRQFLQKLVHLVGVLVDDGLYSGAHGHVAQAASYAMHDHVSRLFRLLFAHRCQLVRHLLIGLV